MKFAVTLHSFELLFFLERNFLWTFDNETSQIHRRVSSIQKRGAVRIATVIEQGEREKKEKTNSKKLSNIFKLLSIENEELIRVIVRIKQMLSSSIKCCGKSVEKIENIEKIEEFWNVERIKMQAVIDTRMFRVK